MDFSSPLLTFFAGAAVRSLAVAVVPVALLALLRVKTASTRHAVLLIALAGMLAIAVLQPLVQPIPLRVLGPAPAAAPLPPISVPTFTAPGNATAVAALPAPPAPVLPRVVAGIYLAGLAFFLARLVFGILFTRRLVAGARPVESGLGREVYESTWISVPLTAGWIRPRILLPANWREWAPSKLDAVLVHERHHVRRGDWAIAILAGVNRSLYWFHPLAWWLERRLAALAEEACDDAALLALGERESYAEALLDMAAAVRSGQGRLVWDAMAMAKGAEVRTRIERILDETRQIPRGLSRSRRLALAAASLPLIYVAAALRPAPAIAQEAEQTPPAIMELLAHRANMTPADAATIEQYLAGKPNDVAARLRLIMYYFATPQKETRLAHIYWLIANHPETAEAEIASSGVTPRATSFNTVSDFERAGALWREQTASHPNDEQVLVHAGMFFAQPGGDPNEAERLFLQAHTLHPNTGATIDLLARLYSQAILGLAGDPKFPNDNPEFGNRVRSQIETSTDGRLLQLTGSQLLTAADSPKPEDHPLLGEARDLGARLRARGGQLLSAEMPPSPTLTAAQAADLQAARDRALAQAGLTGGSLPPSSPSVVYRVPRKTNAAEFAGVAPHEMTVEEAFPGVPVLSPRPTPVSTVNPEYPALARQARIQGIVDLALQIDTSGHVTNIRMLKGHPLLANPAITAVRQYVYPAGVAGAFIERVNFILPEGGVPNAIGNQLQNKTFPFGPEVQSQQTEPRPTAPERIKVGPAVQAYNLVNKVDPVYPALAQQANITGVVTLSIVIGKDGSVENIAVVSGHPLLVQAAIDAVKQWTYKPTLLNGQPVEVGTSVTVPFGVQ